MIYLYLDTETTGLNVATDHIISFSYKMCDEDKEMEKGTIYMNPFETIDEAKDERYAKALEVNGFTPEQIMTFMPAKEGMEMVAKVLQRAKYENGGYWPKVVGYNNVGYDMPIIKANAERYGIELPNIGFAHVDLLQVIWALGAMGKLPVKEGKTLGNKLCESVERFDIDADATKFHGSEYDVEMTYQLYMKLKQVLKIDL